MGRRQRLPVDLHHPSSEGHPDAPPHRPHLARTDGPKSGVFDCPGVETLVVEKGATCRVCGFATTMVPADLPYPELVKLFDTHTCKEKPV